MSTMSRRGFLVGVLMAPAVVRAASIMPVRDPGLVRGIWLNDIHDYRAFELLDDQGGILSLRHEVVWLHKSDCAVQEALETKNTLAGWYRADGVTYADTNRIEAVKANIRQRAKDPAAARLAVLARQQAASDAFLIRDIAQEKDVTPTEIAQSIANNEKAFAELNWASIAYYEERGGRELQNRPVPDEAAFFQKLLDMSRLDAEFQSTLEIVAA